VVDDPMKLGIMLEKGGKTLEALKVFSFDREFLE
jgi:hypothetical protein